MKKILILGLSCLFLLNCSQKIDDTQAEEIIRKTLELTEKDTVEILGISMESKDIALVKFNLNKVQISSKMRKYDKGWQLDEVQNVLGTWIPVEQIIQFHSQPGKQKNAMLEIVIIATGLADYITDNNITPNQSGTYDENSYFFALLCSYYVKAIPIKDPWGNNYHVYCGKACNGIYGISGCIKDDFLIISYGRDGHKEDWEFNEDNPKAGIFIIINDNDFDKDLVNWNGAWIRAPKITEL